MPKPTRFLATATEFTCECGYQWTQEPAPDRGPTVKCPACGREGKTFE